MLRNSSQDTTRFGLGKRDRINVGRDTKGYKIQSAVTQCGMQLRNVAGESVTEYSAGDEYGHE